MKDLKKKIQEEIKSVTQRITQPSVSLALFQTQEGPPEFAEDLPIENLLYSLHQMEKVSAKRKKDDRGGGSN